MPEIRPFRGVRYGAGYLSAQVLAPPFDVIDEGDRLLLTAQSPHNIVWLDKGPEGHDAHWYQQAAAQRNAWLEAGVLQRDAVASFYGYRQSFTVEGKHYTRTGFFAAVRLAPWGQAIYPHERTRSGDRADRLNLTRAMDANMSPVFGMYRDDTGAIDALLEPPAAPALAHAELDGCQHTFWAIQDEATVSRLTALLAERDIVIADGHHRYETALAYQAERRTQQPDAAPGQPYDYVMMYLTNVAQPGLVILPTHRMVSVDEVDQEGLLHRLASDFDLYPVWNPDRIGETLRQTAAGTVAIGMATRDMGTFVLRLRRAALAKSTAEPSLAGLDVVVLQERILEPLLGISRESLAASAHVTYTIHAREALAAVNEGSAELAFILNPTSVADVWEVATQGLAMPQKSTYFYPKLLTGLVINPLDSH
ncbi:MAG: DUF1015 domain-containing protein [Anaerolineae bacterium]|nr:DUF1015 domain-containing protein [Chloroflexota bacterium]